MRCSSFLQVFLLLSFPIKNRVPLAFAVPSKSWHGAVLRFFQFAFRMIQCRLLYVASNIQVGVEDVVGFVNICEARGVAHT